MWWSVPPALPLRSPFLRRWKRTNMIIDYTTFAQVFREHQRMEQSSIGSYYVRDFTRFMQKVTTKASGICSSVRKAHLKIKVTMKTFLFSKLITQ
jgi:hypothetical protein